MVSAFGTINAGPIPWKPRHMEKRIVPEYTERPQGIDQRAYHIVPMRKIFLWPYISPNLPEGRMNVPTVRLKAAAYQLSCPGSFTLKLFPTMYNFAGMGD